MFLYLHTMNLENCNRAAVNDHALPRTRLSSWLLGLTSYFFIKHLLFEF